MTRLLVALFCLVAACVPIYDTKTTYLPDPSSGNVRLRSCEYGVPTALQQDVTGGQVWVYIDEWKEKPGILYAKLEFSSFDSERQAAWDWTGVAMYGDGRRLSGRFAYDDAHSDFLAMQETVGIAYAFVGSRPTELILRFAPGTLTVDGAPISLRPFRFAYGTASRLGVALVNC